MGRPRIAVVGGGLAGLVAADRLLHAGFPVAVFEKYPQAGGLVGTLTVGGTPLERFYHHLFTSDTDYVSFADEFGLGKDLVWLKSRMGFYSGGKLYDFGTPLSLLKFSPLGILGRLQFVLSTLKLRQNPDWKPLEVETAVGWMRKHGYGRALDAVWGPLLAQKYGRLAENVGLVWLWGKIALRTRSRDKSGLGERLGYLKGSFGRGVEAVLTRVKERGGEVRTSRPVKILRKKDGGFAVGFAGGTEDFDCVLSTVAIPELLKLAPDLPEETRRLWSAIGYCHALCPLLELDRSLSPYYWLNVGDVTMPFGGVIEHTNFLPPETYGGRHVVYISNYVLPDDPRWKMRDDDLWARYLPGLRKINPAFDKSWILRKEISRGEYAQPIVVPNYSAILPPIRTPVPGLYTACMAQIYPEDRGQNYAIRIGREAAEVIRTDLG
jgi:protoporphyrinogen oxidase